MVNLFSLQACYMDNLHSTLTIHIISILHAQPILHNYSLYYCHANGHPSLLLPSTLTPFYSDTLHYIFPALTPFYMDKILSTLSPIFKVMQLGCSCVEDLDRCVWCPAGVCTGYTAVCVVFMMRW